MIRWLASWNLNVCVSSLVSRNFSISVQLLWGEGNRTVYILLGFVLLLVFFTSSLLIFLKISDVLFSFLLKISHVLLSLLLKILYFLFFSFLFKLFPKHQSQGWEARFYFEYLDCTWEKKSTTVLVSRAKRDGGCPHEVNFVSAAPGNMHFYR